MYTTAGLNGADRARHPSSVPRKGELWDCVDRSTSLLRGTVKGYSIETSAAAIASPGATIAWRPHDALTSPPRVGASTGGARGSPVHLPPLDTLGGSTSPSQVVSRGVGTRGATPGSWLAMANRLMPSTVPAGPEWLEAARERRGLALPGTRGTPSPGTTRGAPHGLLHSPFPWALPEGRPPSPLEVVAAELSALSLPLSNPALAVHPVALAAAREKEPLVPCIGLRPEEVEARRVRAVRAAGGPPPPTPSSPPKPALVLSTSPAALTFNDSPGTPLYFSALVALESLDGWFLAVHPSTGVVSVREPERRWVEEQRMPFNRRIEATPGGAPLLTRAPLYLFRLVDLRRPERQDAVHTGDDVWLQIVDGRGEEGWASGSVLAPYLHGGVALDEEAVDVAGRPLKGGPSLGAANSLFGLPAVAKRVGLPGRPKPASSAAAAAAAVARAAGGREEAPPSDPLRGIDLGSFPAREAAEKAAEEERLGRVWSVPTRKPLTLVAPGDGIPTAFSELSPTVGGGGVAVGLTQCPARPPGGLEFLLSAYREAHTQVVRRGVRLNPLDRVRYEPADLGKANRPGATAPGIPRPLTAYCPPVGAWDDVLRGPATSSNTTGLYRRGEPGYDVLYEQANGASVGLGFWRLRKAAKEVTPDGLIRGGLGIEGTASEAAAAAAASRFSLDRAMDVIGKPVRKRGQIDTSLLENRAGRKDWTGARVVGEEAGNGGGNRVTLKNFDAIYAEQDFFFLSYSVGRAGAEAVPGHSAPPALTSATGGGGSSSAAREGGGSRAGGGGGTGGAVGASDSVQFVEQEPDGCAGGNRRDAILSVHTAGASGAFAVDRRGVFRIRMLQNLKLPPEPASAAAEAEDAAVAEEEARAAAAAAAASPPGGRDKGGATAKSPPPKVKRAAPSGAAARSGGRSHDAETTLLIRARVQLTHVSRVLHGRSADAGLEEEEEEEEAPAKEGDEGDAQPHESKAAKGRKAAAAAAAARRNDATAADNLASLARQATLDARAAADARYLAYEAAKAQALPLWASARAREASTAIAADAVDIARVAAESYRYHASLGANSVAMYKLSRGAKQPPKPVPGAAEEAAELAAVAARRRAAMEAASRAQAEEEAEEEAAARAVAERHSKDVDMATPRGVFWNLLPSADEATVEMKRADLDLQQLSRMAAAAAEQAAKAKAAQVRAKAEAAAALPPTPTPPAPESPTEDD